MTQRMDRMCTSSQTMVAAFNGYIIVVLQAYLKLYFRQMGHICSCRMIMRPEDIFLLSIYPCSSSICSRSLSSHWTGGGWLLPGGDEFRFESQQTAWRTCGSTRFPFLLL